ncbi:hypothetical protein Alches_12380 [Alicyclobacillus hesperidum subsp. aegles]|uniref:aspartyl-phosphate phosphatase Spo0E family protein n=1 Tax=Alicyclobacillus hesperidum TaxID=89784 RepID=UPI00222A5071|nr:aspartyl-phosphate phosphatase Spo0E family protein [Alicyclobacillus hesperidum]GLG01199.1 hypothetical protein Alches_12380 [Alicyclobacillus hesperidum subsp. aegles]
MSGCIDIIEYLRKKMIHMVETHRDFTNPDVVRISQRLDLFIVQAQKKGMTGNGDGEQAQVVYDESSVKLARG